MPEATDAQVAALLSQGLAFHQQGALARAKAAYQQVLTRHPANFDALHLLGVAELQSGRPDAAVLWIGEALAADPHQAHAFGNLAAAQRSLGRLEEALASCEKAIALKADYAEAHITRGIVLHDLKQLAASLASHDMAIRLAPQLASAHRHRANTLRSLDRLGDALAGHDLAARLAPQDAETHVDRGLTLQALGCPAESLGDFARAIDLNPRLASAHNNHGNVLQELRRYEEAVASHRRAIELQPDAADAWNNFGAALRHAGRTQAALAAFDKAIALQPMNAATHKNRGTVLRELGRLDEAARAYEQALAIDPDLPRARSTTLFLRMRICQWDDFGPKLDSLKAAVVAGKPAASPFSFLALCGDRRQQRQASAVHARRFGTLQRTLPTRKRARGQKIRVGYFSADFHAHATAYLIAQLLESHDRERFEVIAFSFGPDHADTMRTRLRAACDRFIDVRSMPDTDIARISREMDIDIAVDLKGLTHDSRPAIFAHGCAPIQVNYLGYPGTMDGYGMDYIVGDRIVTPAEHAADYAEAIVRMPHCYQVNDSTRAISGRDFTRAELGLPDTGFVYCCFNNNYKITPAVFGIWMRLLAAVRGSVLWLLEDNPFAAANLRKEAQARGVDPARLVFARRMPLDEHLARHHLADLFLDTLPYNAHTTASDALWAGLPVLTRIGESFAGRVAASLLYALDLPELVTHTADDYAAAAIRLANDPAELARLRDRLAVSRRSSGVFDGGRFARDLEAVFEAMVVRLDRGLPPAAIDLGG